MTAAPTPPPPAVERDMLVVDSPHELANWRPLVQWIFFIPHGVVLWALRFVDSALFLLYWVIFLVTGARQRGIYGFMSMYERYSTRSTGYLFGWSEVFPPFDFAQGPDDNNAYPPVRLDLPTLGDEEPPRSAAANIVLAIPHYIVLAVIGIGAAVVAVIAWFAVLFTGQWPEGMRAFLVRFGNYYYRVWAYVTMAHTEYPRFGL